MFSSIPMKVSTNHSHFAHFPARLLLLFAVAILCFTANVNAQNKINTVVGGGTVDPSPLLASAPGVSGVVEDAAGNLYIAPPTSQYIYELSKSTGQVTLFAGTGYISDHHKPGQALTEPLWSPYSLAADSAGNIYIADTGNNAIKMVNPSGNLQTVVGTSKPCFGKKCNDGGTALKALLWNPQGVVVDAGGNIYIADTLDNRVRCVVGTTGGCGAGSKVPIGTILDYAGTTGQSCPAPTKACGDGGKANQSLLNTPVGLAIDNKTGYLYIADSADNRIRRVGAEHVITTVAGTGHACVPSQGCGDGGAAILAYLNHPRGVAVDANENLYIADGDDDVIRLVSSKIISTWAGQLGQPGFSGDGGKPTAANLDSPNGVYVDSSGNVFISDSGNQRVREVTSTDNGKVINTILGGGSAGDGGPATGGQPSYSTLANPYAIAVDANNNWYIADTANNRIRVVNTQSSAIAVATVQVQPGDIQTVAGTGSAGYSGDNGPALSSTLNSPFGVAVDGSGNIYIADSNNGVIREVDFNTGIITTLSATKALTLPSALALDHSGNLFIADPPAEVIWELSAGAMKIVAGNGTAGFSGNGGPATQAELNHPFGVVIDANDNLFIADTANNRVRCVIGTAGGCNNANDPVGTIVPYAYNGQTKFGGDGGNALKASRWLPKELALDQAGNLFIGGGNDAVVQRVDASTGLIITVAGMDTETYFYGFFGDGYASTKAHINDTGIAVDSNEVLLLAETGNDRIRNVPLVPVDQLSAVTLNFGDETVGHTTAPKIVTLQNSGLNDLSFTSIVAAGDFAQTNTCPAQPAVLAPTLSCQISITFTPTEKGVRHGTVTITDNGYESPHVIKLVGVGD